ncbi:hypothetical protein Droror1_Dr00012340 [Drosera rotundifolia]
MERSYTLFIITVHRPQNSISAQGVRPVATGSAAAWFFISGHLSHGSHHQPSPPLRFLLRRALVGSPEKRRSRTVELESVVELCVFQPSNGSSGIASSPLRQAVVAEERRRAIRAEERHDAELAPSNKFCRAWVSPSNNLRRACFAPGNGFNAGKRSKGRAMDAEHALRLRRQATNYDGFNFYHKKLALGFESSSANRSLLSSHPSLLRHRRLRRLKFVADIASDSVLLFPLRFHPRYNTIASAPCSPSFSQWRFPLSLSISPLNLLNRSPKSSIPTLDAYAARLAGGDSTRIGPLWSILAVDLVVLLLESVSELVTLFSFSFHCRRERLTRSEFLLLLLLSVIGEEDDADEERKGSEAEKDQFA